jgi:hypothetical protein
MEAEIGAPETAAAQAEPAPVPEGDAPADSAAADE